jgi:CPA1 family monovalent cation:H+ antiporter
MMVTVIIGRFIWVYGALIYLPRLLFPSIEKKDPYPPWQYPFVISWAGLRGGISLAAALAIPTLPVVVEGVHTRALIIFLVFCVIAATLILQGLTLSWVLKVIGINKYGQREKYNEHVTEIYTQTQMAKAVLRWLIGYKKRVRDNPQLLDEIKLHIREYKMLRNQLKAKMTSHSDGVIHTDEGEGIDETFLLSQIIEVERAKLLELWRDEKINLSTRNRLLDKLDHRSKHISA